MDDLRRGRPYDDLFHATLSGEIEKMVKTWRYLTFAHPIPEDPDEFIRAYNIALALWIKALDSHGINGHPMIIKEALTQTTRYGSVMLSGRTITFQQLRDQAMEGGIDYMIDAWLSGVPLEYVLAD